MGVNRRFFALEEATSVTEFFIDTTKATNTSNPQDSLRFQLPISQNVFTGSGFVISVDDGRADIPVRNLSELNANSMLHFATAGIYKIRLIGSVLNFNCYSSSGVTYDINKIIKLTRIGRGFRQGRNQWRLCINMELALIEPVVLDADSYGMFYGIKKVSCDINSVFSISKVIILSAFLLSVSEPLNSVLPVFAPNLTDASSLYQSIAISSSVTEIKIIAPKLTTFGGSFNGTQWRGRLIIQSEALTDISLLFRLVSNPPSLGEVDIRRVTTATNFITAVMSTANVDATLLGWVNNFDWSVITPVTNKVTLDFKNSKYSNNPSVISAKAFLESKGIVFTNLTMA